MSNTLAAVTQIGEKARELRAARRAESDLAWWGRQIAKATLNGSKRYSNYHRSNELFLLPFWIGRNTSEYATSLQKLLPQGYGFKVKHCDGDENSWIEITWQ